MSFPHCIVHRSRARSIPSSTDRNVRFYTGFQQSSKSGRVYEADSTHFIRSYWHFVYKNIPHLLVPKPDASSLRLLDKAAIKFYMNKAYKVS